MSGLLVEPSGSTSLIPTFSNSGITKALGEKFSELESDDGECSIFVHELWLVADLPLNPFVSDLAKVVIGGPAIVVPKPGTESNELLFGDERRKFIGQFNSDESIKKRLDAMYKRGKTRNNFQLYEEDRWLYNGKAFAAIVVGEDEDHMSDGIPRYNVWIFSKGAREPFKMKIVEFSLREVLEMLIVDDQETAKGQPSEQFRAVLQFFGRKR